jgi:hypothetical protein
MQVSVTTYNDDDALICATFDITLKSGEVYAEFISAYQEAYVTGSRNLVITEAQLQAMGLFEELEKDALDGFDERIYNDEMLETEADLRLRSEKEDF